MDCLTAISSRRTVKQFTGAAVPRVVLERILVAGTWAPTHRLTQPWRFAVLEQPDLVQFSAWIDRSLELIAHPDPAKGQAKWAKLKERLPTLGALIVVTWVRHADPAIDFEDHAAACAATQNILLAATALGLGSFWATPPLFALPEVLTWCGADAAGEGFVGALWLGHVAGALPSPPPRRHDVIRWKS